MPKFRKKPVVIEAWVWNESRTTFNKIGCKMMSCDGHRDTPDLIINLRIETLEGSMRVDKGDYIIKGVKGEYYPCKPDIFKLTYDFEGEENMIHDSFNFRKNKQYRDTLPDQDKKLMDILIVFGSNIDPHGYDDGDYSLAIKNIKELFKSKGE